MNIIPANRITPAFIKVIQQDEIFVFGSNTAGKHGKGAAKQAMQFGAIYGQGFGLQGQAFAIPTKDRDLKPLSLKFIELFIYLFTGIAAKHPDKHFLVTEIGCGLAGYSVQEIAPMFQECINKQNIQLPLRFWFALGYNQPAINL